MQIDWRRNEMARVPRALGPMSRVLAKKTQPSKKKKMEERDLSQP